MSVGRFDELRQKAEDLYKKQDEIRCPYFNQSIVLNSDGFHHLQFHNNRRERNKREQLLKFRLLPLALQVIEKSGTIQEYRKLLIPVGKASKRDGMRKMKEAQYFGLYAIVGEREQVRIRVVLRRVGNGNTTFWSVMPGSKLKDPKLYKKGITDE